MQGPYSWIRPGLGIDLGTANTVVCHPRRGVLLSEPSYMVLRSADDRSGQPVLVGAAARDMTGRTPNGMTTVRPLQDGVITDLAGGRAYIVALLKRLQLAPWERIRPRAIIGVPSGATSLERQALIEAAQEAGLGRVDLLPEPIAGAIGSGLDPLQRKAQMVVDIGGGTAEVTAFCYSQILSSRSCRVAGDEMTAALLHYLRQEHLLVVGELTAEQTKMRVTEGSRNGLLVRGRDASSGRPRTLKLQSEEAARALKPTLDSIVDTLTATFLDDLPAEAVADIMADGVVAFGGGSLLKGFGRRLEEALGFKVRVAANPLTCVGQGAAAALNRPEVIRAFGAS